MKKYVSIFLACVITFASVGCNQNAPIASVPEIGGTSTDTSTKTPAPTQKATEAATQSTTAPANYEGYENYAKISGKDIYVNYKDGRRKDNKSTSIVFHNDAVTMTSLVFGETSNFYMIPLDVFDLLNNSFVFNDVASYADANFFGYDSSYCIMTEFQTNVKIGNLETLQFIGSVDDENGRNCYAYGYSFFIENTPCMLVGFVFSEGQESELIESVTAEVDAMIKTVRTKR